MSFQVQTEVFEGPFDLLLHLILSVGLLQPSSPPNLERVEVLHQKPVKRSLVDAGGEIDHRLHLTHVLPSKSIWFT